ncbi:MAG: hypothetical protein JXM79_13260 [Sedimentisphaerales bacterium]|nr:hypothetical protein [Sedimentisphaerales bacterium]
MKHQLIFVLLMIIIFFEIAGTSRAVPSTSFDISQSLQPGSSNPLGLAVNPENGHIFISTLSYGGQDNLYEFDYAGVLIHSTRVNYDFGNSGNMGSMVVEREGHLYVCGTYYDTPLQPDHSIIEMSQGGQIIYSTVSDMGHFSGISYDPYTDNLFYIEYLSLKNYRINEITTEGMLVSQFSLRQPIGGKDWYRGLVYDPVSTDIYVGEYNTNLLDRYSKNASNKYEYIESYIVPISYFFDVDINRSTSLFYANNHEEVVIFDLAELNSLKPIPAPGAAILGAIGFSFVSMFCRRKHRDNRDSHPFWP